VLGPRVALPAAVVGTLELLVEALAAPPPLAGGTIRVGRVAAIAVQVVGVAVAVLVVGTAARPAPLRILLLDMRRRGVLDRRHDRLGARYGEGRLNFSGLRGEDRRHCPFRCAGRTHCRLRASSTGQPLEPELRGERQRDELLPPTLARSGPWTRLKTRPLRYTAAETIKNR